MKDGLFYFFYSNRFEWHLLWCSTGRAAREIRAATALQDLTSAASKSLPIAAGSRPPAGRDIHNPGRRPMENGRPGCLSFLDVRRAAAATATAFRPQPSLLTPRQI